MLGAAEPNAALLAEPSDERVDSLIERFIRHHSADQSDSLASSALKRLPVSIRCLARSRPIARGKRCDPPAPGS